MKKQFIFIFLSAILISCGVKKHASKSTNSIETVTDSIPKIAVADTITNKTIPLPVETDSNESPEELSLLFIGDFMGHMDQINAAYNETSKTYDYTNCFSEIKSYLSDADVTLGNLEVTLGVKPYSGYPQFSSPASYASAIKASGVDVLTTANNHSCDKGKIGVEQTIKILDSLKIGHTGTFIDDISKTKNPAYIIHKNNIKVAVLNYTYGTNEIKPTFPNVVNYLDKETIKKDVLLVQKTIKPDQIIAFVHWGIQYKDLPNSSQKELFSYFKSLGVNIVIGAHPHVLQPMEWNKATQTNKENLVVYSLGNFVSHQRTFPRDGGAIFKLILQKNTDGLISIKDAKYHLTWVHEPVINNKKEYFILSPKEYINNKAHFKNKADYDKMMRFTNHARTLLGLHNKNIYEY